MDGYETLLVTKNNGFAATIVLNRPEKKNAINTQMFDELATVLQKLGMDDDVTIVAITGAGDSYCSGNDITNFSFMWLDSTGAGSEAKQLESLLRRLVATCIDFPKPLVGLVNGPAIGLGVTLLGLFDLVYASEKATFQTPFSLLGMSPEGCSSYTFPKLMGSSRASEMLMFNRKLTAKEALERGLVADVFPGNDFRSITEAKLEEMVKLSRKTLGLTKHVVRYSERDLLHRVNVEECQTILGQIESEECRKAAMAFMSRNKPPKC